MGAEGTLAADAERLQERRSRSVVGFVARFLGLLILFYTAYTLSFESAPVQLHLRAIARAAHLLLSLLYDVDLSGTVIQHQRFGADVGIGCDASYPILCFVAGVLAFSATWRQKLVALVFGVGLLEFLNLLRIVTLFVIGVHYYDYFHLFHTMIWEGLFVLVSLLLWSLWASRVVRPRS